MSINFDDAEPGPRRLTVMTETLSNSKDSPENRIFLAHAREDKKQIREIYAGLKDQGFDPWLDEIDLEPGVLWKVEISKVIRQAALFVACFSRVSVAKNGYVQREFREALSAYKEKPPGSRFLMPVRLDECDVPDFRISEDDISFRDVQWVDLWKKDGLERLYNGILRALEVVTRGRKLLEASARKLRHQELFDRTKNDLEKAWHYMDKGDYERAEDFLSRAEYGFSEVGIDINREYGSSDGRKDHQ